MRKFFFTFCAFFLINRFFIYPEALSLWIMRNNANSEVIIKNLLEDFERENGLTVEVEVLDWGVAFGKISEALKNKKTPDVLQLGTTWIAYFADLGFLADLSEYSTEIDFKRFNSVNLETCRIFGNSSYYAVPWFIDVRAFFYNKEYMDSLKVKPSELKDYYDFKNYLYKIKKADFRINDKSVYPFGFSGKNDWNVVHNFAPWIWSEGGDFISFKDGNWQSSLFDKNTIKGICKYIDFYEEDLNSFEALKENSALIQQRFARGEYGTIFSVADIIKTIENEYLIGGETRSPLYKKGYYILGTPKGDAGSFTFIGGSALSIPSYKKDNKNAIKLLKYITSSEKLNAYCSEVRFMPTDTTLWERWKDKENYNKLIELINTGKTFPNIPQWGIVGSKLVNCFGDVLELAGSSFFTYEKLYDILFKYNEELNDFFKVDKKVEISKDDFIIQIMDCKRKANINSYNNKEKKIIPVASLFFLFLFAIVIFLLFFRDKKFSIKIIGLKKSVVSSFIVFVVITQMLIIFAASYIIVKIFIERDFSEIIAKNNNISKNISMYIDSKLEAYIGKLDILSNTDSFTKLDEEGIKKVLASQFYSQIFISGEKVFVVDEKNNVICDNSITMPFDFKKSIKDFNISMVLPPAPYVSEVFLDNLSPKINIAVGITIHNKGAIVGEFSLNRITDFIRQQKINNNSFIILTDSKGDIIDYYGLKIEKKLANIADMGFKSGSAEYFKKNKIRKITIPKNGIFSVSREFTNDDKIGVFVFERSGNVSIIAGENFIFIVFIFLMILFETLIISAYIYRTLIKPINRLSKILKKKDTDRILTKESDIRFLNMNNEIGSLFSGYDYLIKDINLKNNELISLNNNLNDLVIERTKDLEEANLKLRRLDNLKNDFIANITHDFRSPLTGLIGYCELLLRRCHDEELKESYEIIYKSSKKLQNTTERLLDLAKLDSKGFIFNIKTIDIKKLIKEIVDFFSPSIIGTNIKIILSFPEKEITNFYSDEDKLEEIISNLLSNAIKYVDKDKGEIKIEVDNTFDNLNIRITDNGIGISPDQIEGIFSRFKRVENEINSNIKGSGIGLSFVKQLTEYLKGRIYVKSEGVGQGATFTLTLPKGKEKYIGYNIIE